MPVVVPAVVRREIVQALRQGVVPKRGLEHLADGLDRFAPAVDEELAHASLGHGVVKAVRGEYGAGKTFFSRWLQHGARMAGFATAEVPISESETPLHRMETIYRRVVASLEVREYAGHAFQSVIDGWLHELEDEVLARGGIREDDAKLLAREVRGVLEKRLAKVSESQPVFAACLREIHQARAYRDNATEQGLTAWLMGMPNVGGDIKRRAGITGNLDHGGAGGFLRGLLEILRQTGRRGLVVVLDEVETVQRLRKQEREKALNALRQFTDDVQGERYPGLYVLITGTPDLFEGPRGFKALEPLRQRFQVEFDADPRMDATRAIQIRLPPFDEGRLIEVGRRVRDLYPARNPTWVMGKVSDATIVAVARAVVSGLKGKVGVAPRLFLKKLVDLLDRVDEHDAFDPAVQFRISGEEMVPEMTAEERQAAGLVRTVDDIELDPDGA